MKKNNKITIFLCVFCFSVAVSYSQIRKVAPYSFEEEKQEKGVQFILNGAGIKKILSFKVFGVALYLPEGGKPENILDDTAKSVEIVYLQNISKSKLVGATIKGFKRNTTRNEYKAIKEQIDQCLSYYTNVRPQDRIIMTYVPERGTTIIVNEEKMGTIIGADFARALYAIWVGQKPVDRLVKNALLGKTEDQLK